jgi:hypothetical protein
MRATFAAAVAAIGVALMLPVSAAGPTFRADYKFTGTALTAFKPLGQADWKVQGGEIVGTPKDANGGWLLLDGKAFQDTQIYASVKCVAGCKAGFLMRAEKTPDGGMKGVLMSVTEGDLVPYMVKIDAQGKEISREALQPGAGRAGGGGGAAAGGRGAAAVGGGGGRGWHPRAPAGWCSWCAGSPAAGAPRGAGAARAGGGGRVRRRRFPELAAQLPEGWPRPAGAFMPAITTCRGALRKTASAEVQSGSLGGSAARDSRR